MSDKIRGQHDEVPPDVVFEFDHTTAAPGGARRALRPMSLGGELAGAVELVVSELVTNIVLHTDDGGEMRAWNDDPVRVEVQDSSPAIPTERPSASVGGRGLRIVGETASCWGAQPVEDGKVVWAVFDRPAPH